MIVVSMLCQVLSTSGQMLLNEFMILVVLFCSDCYMEAIRHLNVCCILNIVTGEAVLDKGPGTHILH